jgi:hypothetical protein
MHEDQKKALEGICSGLNRIDNQVYSLVQEYQGKLTFDPTGLPEYEALRTAIETLQNAYWNKGIELGNK